MKYRSIVIMLSTLTLLGCDKLPLSESFVDCVLDKVSKAVDEKVANMLRESCATKHQVELPAVALGKIEGTAGQALLGFAIHINNRNREWIISEIEFYVNDGSGSGMKSYLKKVHIEPLSKDAFFPSIDNKPKEGNKDFSWGIIKAWGIPRKS